jgi:hypothetical protein
MDKPNAKVYFRLFAIVTNRRVNKDVAQILFVSESFSAAESLLRFGLAGRSSQGTVTHTRCRCIQ